jgi:MFS transporter, MHS family, proline/betaine transporter
MSYWGFQLLSHGLVYAWIGTLILTLLAAPIISCYTAIMLGTFDTQVRYTGFSLSFNIGFALFGGTIPFISTYLIHHMHTALAPCYYLISIACIALLTMLFMHKPLRIRFPESIGV